MTIGQAIYNLGVVVGFGYLVEFHSWDIWWMLVGITLINAYLVSVPFNIITHMTSRAARKK